jgi:hypothetical protein
MMTVFVAQKPRPIVSQLWLHVSAENLFGLKKMPISIDNHNLTSVGQPLGDGMQFADRVS